MTNYKPYILLALGLIVAFLWFRDCHRKPEPAISKTYSRSEADQQRVVTGRDKKNEQLAADTLKYLTQLEAHSRTISRLMANGKQKDKELAALYAKYAEKPTPGICDTLVREQKGRIDSLKQEVATRRLDSLNKANMLKVYADHLFDKDVRIDSLNTIAKDANQQAAKWEKKAKKRGKIIGFGAAIIAAVAGGVAALR